jgi:hypothetical protein
MAVISKGIELSYKAQGGSEFIALTNLQEIPELGGDTEAIEITTLADAAHTYTDGLKNYGDSLAFVFLYETAQFETLNGLEGVSEWQVSLPDGTTCSFSGTSSVKLAGAGVNVALTYTLAVKPNSEMIWG